MEKITIEDQIKSLKYNTIHKVVDIEEFDDVTLVYTEDSKSFPLHDVVKFNPFQEFMDYNEKKSKGEEIKLDEKTQEFYSGVLTVDVEISPEQYFELKSPITKIEKKSIFEDILPILLTSIFIFSFIYVFGNIFYEIYSIIK
jgi:hypothetical protein